MTERKKCLLCDFYGDEKYNNLCSKCYEVNNKQDTSFNKTKLNVDKKEEEKITGDQTNTLEKKPKKKQRCSHPDCNKILSLVEKGRPCKCGLLFCGSHFCPELHNCSYDFCEEKNEILKDKLDFNIKKFKGI
tara:strand:- start:412 stop:807 length:396 start_codon:yes stop_codon:yes gene_type:complete